MCDNIIYRLGKNDDLKSLLHLDFNIFKEKINIDYYKIPIINKTCYVALKNNKIMGCILFYKKFEIKKYNLNIGYVVSLFSLYHKCKIGQNLLQLAINDIGNKIPIGLHVCVKNYKAINLYFKIGFKIQEIEKNAYGNNDGFLMIKNIE